MLCLELVFILLEVFCHSWIWKYSLSFPPDLAVLIIIFFSCPFQFSPSGTQIMCIINPFNNAHRLDCKASSLWASLFIFTFKFTNFPLFFELVLSIHVSSVFWDRFSAISNLLLRSSSKLLGSSVAQCRCRRCRRREFDSWMGKVPWRRKWKPTPVFLPEQSCR